MSRCITIFIKSLLSLVFASSLEVRANILDVMEVCQAEGELTASTIEKAAISRWPYNPEYRMWWYILLCMESGFNPKAGPSSAGAIGIGQIMPEYAKEFAARCGIPAPSIKKLWELETNLAISSCHYNHLLTLYNGNVALALAAYNAGTSSEAIKKIKQNKTRSLNKETMGYLALAFSLWQKLYNK